MVVEHKAKRATPTKAEMVKPLATAAPVAAGVPTSPKTPATKRRKANPAAEVRSALGVSRKVFSRMTGFSERAIADWESGKAMSSPALLRIKEMSRLRVAMVDVMRPASIPRWLETPCSSLGGLTPIECLERGEIDRVWRTIFYLGSGVPT